MSRLARLLGIALSVVVLAACTRSADLTTDQWILPDLDQAAPSRLSIFPDGERQLLVFASAVDNVGRAPLIIEGRRDRLVDPMEVAQIVNRVDGGRDELRIAGVLRYVDSDTHSHWHLEGFERYELRRRDGTTVGRDRKTGFCLGDRYERRGWRSKQEPPEAVLVGECNKGKPGALRVREGISPGYGDDYEPWLEGQYIDVTGLEDGTYVLVHRADPDALVVEETRANNAASVRLRLETTADGLTVDVLRVCPESARCG